MEMVVGSVIGAVTFTGSVVAFGKLKGSFGSSSVLLPGRHLLNIALAFIMGGLSVYFMSAHDQSSFLAATFIALALGILLVIPIGGADMPVVVSMLNSYSGWAASATGF